MAPKHGIRTMVVFSALGLVVASAATAQEADTLLAKLESPDWVVRANAVNALYRLDAAALPPGWPGAAVDLLRREAARVERATDPLGEGYGEYLIDVVLFALRADDPAAVVPLITIGIGTSVAARRFVARHPDAALPALLRLWSADWRRRPDVVATLGAIVQAERSGATTLAPAQRWVVDRQLLEAAADMVSASRYAFVATVGPLGLAEWTPLVRQLAENDTITNDPLSFTKTTAARWLPALEAARRAISTVDLLVILRRLQAALCDGASGARRGQCTALESLLRDAARQLDAGRRGPARRQLEAYRRHLDGSGAARAFEAVELVLLRGNAEELIDRLGAAPQP